MKHENQTQISKRENEIKEKTNQTKLIQIENTKNLKEKKNHILYLYTDIEENQEFSGEGEGRRCRINLTLSVRVRQRNHLLSIVCLLNLTELALKISIHSR